MISPYTFLFIFTLLIDIVLIYILYNFHLNCFDKVYTIIMLFIHFIFIIGLFFNIYSLLEIGHLFVFLSYFISPFIDNIYILILLLLFIVITYLSWDYFGDCPLKIGDEPILKFILQNTGINTTYPKPEGSKLEYIFIIVSFVLLYKIYNRL
jgi:hypothetical protein